MRIQESTVTRTAVPHLLITACAGPAECVRPGRPRAGVGVHDLRRQAGDVQDGLLQPDDRGYVAPHRLRQPLCTQMHRFSARGLRIVKKCSIVAALSGWHEDTRPPGNRHQWLSAAACRRTAAASSVTK